MLTFKSRPFLAEGLLKFEVICVGASETRFHYVAQVGFKLLLSGKLLNLSKICFSRLPNKDKKDATLSQVWHMTVA